jgi:glyoxylase-like metal-dependent hydrolase (beta-lactamase superfamily II)
MRKLRLMMIIAAAATPAAAQQQDFSDVEIRVQQLAPGVAVLFGRGGNIGLSHGDDGNVLIDDQFAPLTERILAAVRTLDADPVRFVVNTHWHSDHTGGNENLGRRGAVILAHHNVRERMSTEQVMKALDRTVPPSPKEALPVVTFGDGVALHLNGDTLHVVHVANAHTDGDSLVHWQNSDVLHMGDIFFHQDSLPFIDIGSGGSIDGLIAGADKGLELAGPNTKVIPGHGPMATRADLAGYRDMLVDVRGKVAEAIAAGRTLEQIKAATPAAAYGPADGFIKPDQFVEAVYTSLRNPPAAKPHSH